MGFNIGQVIPCTKIKMYQLLLSQMLPDIPNDAVYLVKLLHALPPAFTQFLFEGRVTEIISNMYALMSAVKFKQLLNIFVGEFLLGAKLPRARSVKAYNCCLE